MGFEIKKLGATDISSVRQFIAQLHIENGETEPAEPTDGYLATLLSSSSFHVLVALDGDKVIGGLSAYELPMLSTEQREMFLYDIVVLEPYRRLGIARRLIDSLKEICVAGGIRIVFVGTSSDSDAAIKLYKATGGEMDIIPWFTYNLSGT